MLIPFSCIGVVEIKMLILLPIIFFYFTVVGRAIFEVFCVFVINIRNNTDGIKKGVHMIKIRNNLFKTNSISTHSLTMCKE